MNLYATGVRPYIDRYLLEKSKEVRNYGKYWSASSAGYCQRKTIFERLGVPYVEKEDDARKQRLFTSGHIFHKWYQDITKAAGISVAQELELQDEELMVRGHFDDLVLIEGRLVLYDAKTQNSRAFSYARPEMSWYHRHQLGTYMYLIRKLQNGPLRPAWLNKLPELQEGRILKLSKDDLRMEEEQLLWTPALESDVVAYWKSLNTHWKAKTLPACTCADHENGFMAQAKYNPYYYHGQPCSIDWYAKFKSEGVLT